MDHKTHTYPHSALACTTPGVQVRPTQSYVVVGAVALMSQGTQARTHRLHALTGTTSRASVMARVRGQHWRAWGGQMSRQTCTPVRYSDHDVCTGRVPSQLPYIAGVAVHEHILQGHEAHAGRYFLAALYFSIKATQAVVAGWNVMHAA